MYQMIMDIAQWIVTGYMICIFYYVISSWIPPLGQNVIGKMVTAIVEPYLQLFRFIPPIGMIDVSPIIAIFAYQYLSHFFLMGVDSMVRYFM